MYFALVFVFHSCYYYFFAGNCVVLRASKLGFYLKAGVLPFSLIRIQRICRDFCFSGWIKKGLIPFFFSLFWANSFLILCFPSNYGVESSSTFNALVSAISSPIAAVFFSDIGLRHLLAVVEAAQFHHRRRSSLLPPRGEVEFTQSAFQSLQVSILR